LEHFLKSWEKTLNSQKQQLGQRNFAFLQLHFTFMPLNDSPFEIKKNKDILILN